MTETNLKLSTYAAARRLKERFDPNKAETIDESLKLFRDAVAAHEAADDRHMIWLAEVLVEAVLARYVECEGEIAHFAANKYEKEERDARAKLQRIEAEWRIAASLSAYFRAVHAENSAQGIADFLKARRGAKG